MTTVAIHIHHTDAARLISAIAGGLLTPEQVAGSCGLPLIDGCVLLDRRWHADDGNAEVIYERDEAASAQEAGDQYATDGEWGDGVSLLDVRCWRVGIDAEGDECDIDEHTIAVTVGAETEPDCESGEGHDWQSPHDIVGGIVENPGVSGHGGGVTVTEVCMRCGCGRHTDTWAQDRATGRLIPDSVVTYEVGEFSGELTRDA